MGTGSLVETLQLAYALDNKGQLTAVDSTAQGITLIRKAFAELQDETATTLRAVNAPASVFLPRLNANDYDLIVVAGDAESSNGSSMPSPTDLPPANAAPRFAASIMPGPPPVMTAILRLAIWLPMRRAAL